MFGIGRYALLLEQLTPLVVGAFHRFCAHVREQRRYHRHLAGWRLSRERLTPPLPSVALDGALVIHRVLSNLAALIPAGGQRSRRL
jgi:hypothetical protein